MLPAIASPNISRFIFKMVQQRSPVTAQSPGGKTNVQLKEKYQPKYHYIKCHLTSRAAKHTVHKDALRQETTH